MECFGQCSGKEGTGFYCAAGEHVLEKDLSEACEREEEREESFSGEVFCYFQSAKCHWRLPLWKHIFKIRISEKGSDLFRDWTSQGTQRKVELHN